MEITYTEGKFVCHSSYDERAIPKKAKFRWDPSKKHWWTDDPKKACRLREYADKSTIFVIDSLLASEKESIEASKKTASDISIPAPEGQEYLPFQKAGIEYALNRPNVLIGDDMGLGKTIQAIGIINADTSIEKVLIICPATLRLNWKQELEKWLIRPLSIKVVENGKDSYSNAQIAIINYDLLKKYRENIRAQNWDIMIVDECHFIKNPKANRTKEILGNYNPPLEPISAKRKIFITGTPIVNRPIEMFPILRATGIFQSWKYYVTRYCNGHKTRWGWDVSGASNLDELQDILRSKIMVRRLKKDVLTELPLKRRQVIEIPANGCAKQVKEEKKVYEKHQGKITALQTAVELAKASDNEEDYNEAITSLKTAQLLAFTEISKKRHETALAKIPVIIEYLKNATDGQKIICFAHHKDVIAAIANEFAETCVTLTGDTSMENRQAAVDRFQKDPNCTLFIGSITAAGVGITLTASSNVIFAELDWVPGNITQAEDRAHRIGQQNSVLIQHLVLEGSIDANMAKQLIEKQKIIDRALDTDHPTKEIEQIKIMPAAAISTRDISKAEIEKEAEEITDSEILLAHEKLKILASFCDGAVERDGMGFNKFDSSLGKALASLPELTKKQAVLAQKMVKKYHRQLT